MHVSVSHRHFHQNNFHVWISKYNVGVILNDQIEESIQASLFGDSLKSLSAAKVKEIFPAFF
jgi:hypothetical protein